MDKSIFNLTKEELINKLNKQEKKIEKLNQQLISINEKYHTFKKLFDYSPTSMWEIDITKLLEYYNTLKQSGNRDVKKYFEQKDNLYASIKMIKIIKINKAALKLHQAKSQKYLTENFLTLFTDKLFKTFKELIFEIAEGKTEFQLNTRAKTFNNDIIEISLYINISKRTRKNKTCFFALFSVIDITNQTETKNKLKTNEKALRSILDASQDVALLVDKKGFILESNKACQNLFGVKRTALIGRKLSYYTDKNTLEQQKTVFKEAIKHKKIITFKNKAYGKYWNSTISPLLDKSNNVEKVAIFHRDVTKIHLDEKRIRESEAKYRTIFNNIQTSITHVNPNGIITDINDYHIKRIGKGKIPKEEFIGTSILERKPIIEAGVVKHYKNLLDGKPFNLKRVYFPYTTGGTEGYFNLTGTPLFDDLKLSGGIITVEDVTQQILSEKKIRESEEKFRTLAELSPVAISIIKDAEKTKYLYVNTAWEYLTGYKRNELNAIESIDFIHPDMKELIHNKTGNSLNGKDKPSRYEIKTITKNGKIKWVDFTAAVIEYNNSPAILTAILDITERKNTEKALKEKNEELRNLSKYLNNIREEERKNIAREIHDNLGQKLTALNLDISWIQEKIPSNLPDLKNEFIPILNLVEESIIAIQKLSTELRPGILDDLGLNNAIQWQTNEISRRTKLNLNLDLMPKEIELNEDIKIALFRVYQEALTNIVRHADATSVFVKLKQNNKNIYFEIMDDGIGIPEVNINDHNSFGLIGMKERITAINGTIEFLKRKPKGTTIRIEVPMQEESK